PADDGSEPALLLAARSADALLAALDRVQPGAPEGEGSFRLALFNPTPERRAKARAIVARGEAWRGRDDVWFSSEGLAGEGGRVAFLFPGVDSSFEPRITDVARRFDLPIPLPKGMRELRAGHGSLKETSMGILAVGRVLDQALRAIGVRPDFVGGHSIGE